MYWIGYQYTCMYNDEQLPVKLQIRYMPYNNTIYAFLHPSNHSFLLCMHQEKKINIGEAPIPNRNPIDNFQDTVTLITLGLNFDEARTNNTMTHVLVQSCYGRLQTLVICLSQLLASRIYNIFIVQNKTTKKFAILLIPIFLHGKYLHRVILLQTWHINS